MGVMRFLVYPPELLDEWPEVFRGYVSGMDGRVFPTRIEVHDNVLACRRQTSESGKFAVSWPVPGFGRPVLLTSSLTEREEPYVLAVELARGRISQIRDQVAAWEMAGMTVSEEFTELHRRAHQLFARAVAIQDQPAEASELAQEALTHAVAAGDLVTKSYIQQRLAVRRKRSSRLPALLGCHLESAQPGPDWNERYTSAFNAAAVPVCWKTIEPQEGEYHWELNDAQVDWCEEQRLMMTGGPLLDFSPDGLPQWLSKWSHDVLNLQSFVADFVETAISRYSGRIRNWEVAVRANTGGLPTLNEEQRLMVVARALEVARQMDGENQLIVRIDQPWGAYQSRGRHQLSPLQFVDALARAGVGLSAIHLEFAVGYRPRGSASRGLLDLSRLIDQWSVLGLPLHVTLAFPSGTGPDSLAQQDLMIEPDQWKATCSEEAQAEWLDQYLPLLMAKQIVVGIFWAHFHDGTAHQYPHAGMLRPDGSEKPALTHLVRYHQLYWDANGDESTVVF